MSTQANPVARSAEEREDTLHELANVADAIAKAMRHASKLTDGSHSLIKDIWRNLARTQRYIADAQEDVRIEPFTPRKADDAA